MSNFTSSWVQYPARRETGDSRAVMSIQEHLSRILSISLLFFCAYCLSGTEVQCHHVHKSVEWPNFGLCFKVFGIRKRTDNYWFSLRFTQPISLLKLLCTFREKIFGFSFFLDKNKLSSKFLQTNKEF